MVQYNTVCACTVLIASLGTNMMRDESDENGM